jgi:ribosome biogenesis GTPase
MCNNEGMVTKSIGGLYNVETPLGIYECTARGIFRKMNISPYVGDNVLIEEIADGKAVIAKIYERKNSLIRPPLANLDQLVFVISTCEPAPNLTLLDKFIAISVYKGIDNIIAVTKTDIEKNPELIQIYRKINMDIIEIDYSNPKSYIMLYDKLEIKSAHLQATPGLGNQHCLIT